MQNPVNFVTILFIILFAPQAYAESLRVSPEWLNNNLHSKDLIIIDSRTENDYEIEHIAGAISLSHELTYQQKQQGGNIVEPDVMQKILQHRGIDNTKKVVVYDGGEMFDASRVFWALEVYGIKDVKVLTPGYQYWSAKSYSVNSDIPRLEPGNYVPSIDHRKIASKFATQLATNSPGKVIVDARSYNAYSGKESTAKRFGHIPSAISIPVSVNLMKMDGVPSLRGLKELADVYAHLPKDKKVILYCEVGRVSSTNYLILRELGYDVANYDASWREWGNDLNLPIEK
ncbi:MAG: rhodanese-like domain-containing protein [Gammaproteobacteria bacterium]|nr:rhodanese-like domain-containing protein [Gammaproteobacteria bacterium]